MKNLGQRVGSRYLVLAVLTALAVVLVAPVSGLAAGKVLKVGATPVPHAEILQVAKGLLEKQGIKLEIVEFQDYVQPNLSLDAGELDANFFQHIPYLETFSKDRNLKLTYIAKVHIEPMALYSTKVKSLKDLKAGAVIGIPNDPTNGGRALLLLQSAKLITLKKSAGIKPTPLDIEQNPRKLQIKELEAAQLPRVLPDVDAAVINGNYAIQAGLDAEKNGLFVENAESPYVNVLAVRVKDKDDKSLKALAAALTSKEVRDFIRQKYQGAVVPVF
ncbi:MAG: MetQ/NlpA family ABC transporter substrate-binding protein [Chitinophagales bacterium]